MCHIRRAQDDGVGFLIGLAVLHQGFPLGVGDCHHLIHVRGAELQVCHSGDDMAGGTAAVALVTQVDATGLHQQMDAALGGGVAAGVVAGGGVDTVGIPGAGQVYVCKGSEQRLHQLYLQFQHIGAAAVAPGGTDLVIRHIGASLPLVAVQLRNRVKKLHGTQVQLNLVVGKGQHVPVGVGAALKAGVEHRGCPQVSAAFVCAVRVNPGHNVNIDGIQQVFIFLLIQLVNDIQSTFAGGVLVTVHLGLIAHVGQTVGGQLGGYLLQSGAAT